MNDIIIKYAKNKRNFFFIQIGANDGMIEDPVYSSVIRYGWKGILVEPIKHYYKRLIDNYSKAGVKENLIFKNVAICTDSTAKIIYRIKEDIADMMGPWAHGQGSFIKENVINEIRRVGELEEYKKMGHNRNIPFYIDSIIEEQVSCITFDRLIKNMEVKKIDLLQMDTQGYDFEILKTIDFTYIKPVMINFESDLLSQKDKEESKELLYKNGYKTRDYPPHETFAWQDIKSV